MSSSITSLGRIAALSSLAAALSLPVYAGVASAEPLSAPPGGPPGSPVGLVALSLAVTLALALLGALVLMVTRTVSLPSAALAGPRACPLCGSPRDFDGVCGSCGGRLAFSAAW